MTVYGPLHHYAEGVLDGTVVDPRFGTGATPIQPFGWGGEGTAMTPTGNVTTDTDALLAAFASGSRVALAPGQEWVVGDTLRVASGTEVYSSPSTTIKAATNMNKRLLENVNMATGDTGIVLSGLRLDNNRANQSGDNFEVVRLERVTESVISQVRATGGKRTTNYEYGGHGGEGVVLALSERNVVDGLWTHDNQYDGFKLRQSNHNMISNVSATENGRAGIQIYTYDPADGQVGSDTAGSNHNTFTNITVQHSTGIPGPGAPTCSGLYVHTGRWNTFSNFTLLGVRQGIGFWANGSDNTFSSGTIRYRSTDRAALDIEDSTAKSARNTFAHLRVDAISGTGGPFIKIKGGNVGNRFYGCHFTGTGIGFSGSPDMVDCYSNGAAVSA